MNIKYGHDKWTNKKCVYVNEHHIHILHICSICIYIPWRRQY